MSKEELPMIIPEKKMAIKSWRFIMIMKGSRNGAQENGQRKKKEHRLISEFTKK